MNREIKFRGKCIDTGEWVYGYYAYHKDYGKGRDTHRIYEVYAESDPGAFFTNYHEVDPDTVGQYTGLKDKNGTNVWEGDLLLTPERDIMVAEWQDAKIITRCVRPANPRYVNSLTFAYPVSGVIGNIYDNPELLEDGK